MLVRNATESQIREALERLNDMFGGNIELMEYRPANERGTAHRFRLRVKDSHGPGARLSQGTSSCGNRRHMINGCWHAHGHFFEELFKIAPGARVWVDRWITKDGGNWEDRNIGSMMEPLMYSDACECNQ